MADELWRRLDPPDWIANEQQSYDKDYEVWRLRQAGRTLEAIARDMGVSRERIRQREAKFLRQRGVRSPIERWLEGWRDDIGKTFGWREKIPPVRLDGPEIIRRLRDIAGRERRAKRAAAAERKAAAAAERINEANWQEKVARAKLARAEMLIAETEWRKNREDRAMGEAKARVDAEMGALLAMCSQPVTQKQMLTGMTQVATMGDFEAKAELAMPPEEQLVRYWRIMGRALPREVVPIIWNRLRCLLEAMAVNPAVREAMGADEVEDGVAWDPQSDLMARVAATMPILPNKDRPSTERSDTATVWCPHEVILSLAHGPT